MISLKQATDLREFLIQELNKSGFSLIVSEISARLEEEYEEDKFERNPRYLLDFFLKESIEVLENPSNRNFPKLIKRFNKNIISEKEIQIINVELLNEGDQTFFDLSKLPDYQKIISTFKEILNEIRKEN